MCTAFFFVRPLCLWGYMIPRKSQSSMAEETVLVYFDNNTTTIIPSNIIDIIIKWMNRGSPSAEYASAHEARKMIHRFQQYLATEGGFSLDGPRGYTLIFTSGGSEGNSHILTATARAYAARTGKLPHIITSAAEHKSVLSCCLRLAQDKMIQLSVLPVRKVGKNSGGQAGTVDPEELRRSLRTNTCLVSIMAANNDTGAINDVRTLGAIAHSRQIPFHTDAVQLFGKSIIRPVDLNLDGFTASFHKLHGPSGVGLLALKNDFIEGYGLGPLIAGSQSGGLRGGDENLPGIAGAFAAYKLTVQDRGKKNQEIRRIRDGIQTELTQRLYTIHVDDYCEARPRIPDGDPVTPRNSRIRAAPKTKRGVVLAQKLDAIADQDLPIIVWLGPFDRTKILPNTILLSVLRSPARGGGLCNKKMRAALEARGIIVSTGSACNALGSDPSHNVEVMDIPPELWSGILRVSLCDNTTAAEAAIFITHFVEIAGSSEVLV